MLPLPEKPRPQTLPSYFSMPTTPYFCSSPPSLFYPEAANSFLRVDKRSLSLTWILSFDVEIALYKNLHDHPPSNEPSPTISPLFGWSSVTVNEQMYYPWCRCWSTASFFLPFVSSSSFISVYMRQLIVCSKTDNSTAHHHTICICYNLLLSIFWLGLEVKIRFAPSSLLRVIKFWKSPVTVLGSRL